MPERHGIARLAAQRSLLAHRLQCCSRFCETRSRIRRRSVSSFFHQGRERRCGPPPPPAPPALPPAPLPPRRDIAAPFAGQPRKHVIQLRQFDLAAGLAAARMPRKDIQDQLRAIDHPALRCVLSMLRCWHRRKVAVENNQRRISALASGANFVAACRGRPELRDQASAQLKTVPGDGSARALRERARPVPARRFAPGSAGWQANARRALRGRRRREVLAQSGTLARFSSFVEPGIGHACVTAKSQEFISPSIRWQDARQEIRRSAAIAARPAELGF